MNLYTDISEWVTFVVYSLFGCATHESPVTHHRVWGGVVTVAPVIHHRVWGGVVTVVPVTHHCVWGGVVTVVPVTHHRVWGGVFTVAVCSISAGDRIRCKRHFTRPSKMPVLFFCCLISPQKMWPFQIRFVK